MTFPRSRRAFLASVSASCCTDLRRDGGRLREAREYVASGKLGKIALIQAQDSGTLQEFRIPTGCRGALVQAEPAAPKAQFSLIFYGSEGTLLCGRDGWEVHHRNGDVKTETFRNG